MTQCESCTHSKVCSLRLDYEKAQRTLAEVIAPAKHEHFTAKLECKNYDIAQCQPKMPVQWQWPCGPTGGPR